MIFKQHRFLSASLVPIQDIRRWRRLVRQAYSQLYHQNYKLSSIIRLLPSSLTSLKFETRLHDASSYHFYGARDQGVRIMREKVTLGGLEIVL